MKIKKTLSVLLSSVLALGLLAACSSDGDSSSDGNGASDGGTVIKIATQSPLSGGSSILGEAIRLGAQLKLEEEQAKFEEMGFKLQLVPYDDQADPKKGVSNAEQLTAD